MIWLGGLVDKSVIKVHFFPFTGDKCNFDDDYDVHREPDDPGPVLIIAIEMMMRTMMMMIMMLLIMMG